MAIIKGTNLDDILNGTNSADEIHGLDGKDEIHGLNGADELFGDRGDDLIFGGNGKDKITGGDGDDEIHGGKGNDIIYGDGPSKVLEEKVDMYDLSSNPAGLVLTAAVVENGVLSPFDASNVTFNADGAGASGTTTPVPNQINYDPESEQSDALRIDFEHHATEIEVGISRAFPNENLGEFGEWKAFNAGGVEVASGVFSDDDGTADGRTTFSTTFPEPVAYIVFTAVPYGNDPANGGALNDSSDYFVETLKVTSEKTSVVEGTGNDTIFGGDGVDVIYGQGGNDTIYGGKGGDEIYGGDGKDTIYGENGNDIIDGGKGKDEIHGGKGNDDINGGRGDDLIFGNEGKDNIEGGKGDDTIYGGKGKDFIQGDDGNDEIHGEKGNDVINGGNGDDQIFGEEGNDTLNGDDGNDWISGGSGNDVINGGDGDDGIWGGDGNDIVNGGDGNDHIDLGNGNDRAHGDAGDDRMFGNAGNDRMWGDEGNDEMYGEQGNDRIFGGEDDDLLSGGTGNDRIFGNDGNDTLIMTNFLFDISDPANPVVDPLGVALEGGSDRFDGGAGMDTIDIDGVAGGFYNIFIDGLGFIGEADLDGSRLYDQGGASFSGYVETEVDGVAYRVDFMNVETINMENAGF